MTSAAIKVKAPNGQVVWDTNSFNYWPVKRVRALPGAQTIDVKEVREDVTFIGPIFDLQEFAILRNFYAMFGFDLNFGTNFVNDLGVGVHISCDPSNRQKYILTDSTGEFVSLSYNCISDNFLMAKNTSTGEVVNVNNLSPFFFDVVSTGVKLNADHGVEPYRGIHISGSEQGKVLRKRRDMYRLVGRTKVVGRGDLKVKSKSTPLVFTGPLTSGIYDRVDSIRYDSGTNIHTLHFSSFNSSDPYDIDVYIFASDVDDVITHENYGSADWTHDPHFIAAKPLNTDYGLIIYDDDGDPAFDSRVPFLHTVDLGEVYYPGLYKAGDSTWGIPQRTEVIQIPGNPGVPRGNLAVANPVATFWGHELNSNENTIRFQFCNALVCNSGTQLEYRWFRGSMNNLLGAGTTLPPGPDADDVEIVPSVDPLNPPSDRTPSRVLAIDTRIYDQFLV